MTREHFSTSGPDREPIIKNRARTFNEIRTEQKAPAMPTQEQIDAMVASAWARASAKNGGLATITKELPVLLSADPLESLIRKVDEGTANPRDVDGMIDGYVRKNMIPEDNGSTPRAYGRLADAGDKHLSRLYTARQTAASTFHKNAIGRVGNRVAAEKQVAEIDAEIKRKAADLRRQFPGKFTQEQATSEVLSAEPEIYSRWMQAKATSKPNA